MPEHRTSASPAFVVLAGGVGGARLVHGLAEVLAVEKRADALTVIVNTGDDFEHWGLSIAPDLDTLMYTLAGLAPMARGWGLAEESFAALEMVKHYGGESWFQLGDRDLATHVLRTQWMREGASLSAVTARLCVGLGVEPRLLPMSDAPQRTWIHTVSDGVMPFQEWLVARRATPKVRRVDVRGSGKPTADVLQAIQQADVVLLAPSNPYVSMDPILGLHGVREAVQQKVVVMVSPIVAGRAVKGPLAAMIPALAHREPSADAVAAHYHTMQQLPLRAVVVQHGDAALSECAGASIQCLETNIVMHTLEARVQLAKEVLELMKSYL